MTTASTSREQPQETNIRDTSQFAYDKIRKRMTELDLDVTELTVEYVSKLFRVIPDQEAQSNETLNKLLDIFERNMVVSDDDLMKYLELSKEDPDLPQSSAGYFFYVRSWELTKTQLDAIMDDFAKDTYKYKSIMDSWTSQVAHKESFDSCYLRYVGVCEEPESSPTKRMTDDLEKPKGFMKNLFEKMSKYDIKVEPLILVLNKDSINVTATHSNAKKTEEMADTQEQVLIGLFGLEQLINSQSGGYNAKYFPTAEGFSKDDYRSLDIKFFAKFNRNFALEGVSDLKNNINNWLGELVNTQETFLSKNSDNTMLYRENILKFATPFGLVCGHTILAMIGHKITENFCDAKSSFDSTSFHEGYLLRDMLSRLEAWEYDDSTWDMNSFRRYIGKIPFVYLIPWFQKGNINEGKKQCLMYLNIVRPLITVAISDAVAGVTTSKLPTKTNHIDVVGVPVLVNPFHQSLNDKDNQGSPSGYRTIVIPHYGPQFDNFTHRTPKRGIRRIMDLTWQITLCIAEIAVDTVCSNETGTREEILKKIMDQCKKNNERKNNPRNLGGLYDKLDNAKKNYKDHRMPSKPAKQQVQNGSAVVDGRTNPPVAGRPFPENREDTVTTYDISAIQYDDSMYIMQEFQKSIPKKIKFIYFTPTRTYKYYKKAKLGRGFREDQIFSFCDKYETFLLDKFREHPRVEESHQMLNGHTTKQGHREHFIILLRCFFKDKAERKLYKVTYKKKTNEERLATYVELQLK